LYGTNDEDIILKLLTKDKRNINEAICLVLQWGFKTWFWVL